MPKTEIGGKFLGRGIGGPRCAERVIMPLQLSYVRRESGDIYYVLLCLHNCLKSNYQYLLLVGNGD